MKSEFIHLHLHSEYSLQDSTVRIAALVEAVANAAMPAVAVTDQSNLFGLVKFYRAAQAAGIKAIVGADVWLRDAQDPKQLDRLVLLCQNDAGYRNLNRILSRAWSEGQLRGVPAAQKDWVAGATEGLIALSGRDGDIARQLATGHKNQAKRLLDDWMAHFDGRFYLEVSRTGREGEERHVRSAAYLGAEAGCPLVATNDVRFLGAKDFETHEARVCIQQGRVLNDPRRPRNYSAEQYLKSAREMQQLFEDLPGALENSVVIAERCNLELRLGQYHLPAYPTPAGRSEAEILDSKAREGLAQALDHYGLAQEYAKADYETRLEQELKVIDDMGFPGYFLIVADFIRWAKEQHIPVGPGRGSGAGSLVAYSLGITTLDPLRYGLLFERFLNPERVSMPDFDVDFCMEKRDRVIEYVAERYGHAQVGQIITFGTMAARAVVRDAGRVLGHPYGFVDRIAKLVPFQIGITLTEALKQDEELKQAYRDDETVREMIDLALALEGLTRNAGRHAGGVVIAPDDLQNFMPLFFEEGGAQPVTQFDKDDVETMGLVKFDFLGLRTLTIIDWAVKAVNAARGNEALDINTIAMVDAATFKLLQACQTTAVFQLESRGMKDLIKRLKPDSFEDIIALVALFRPGPLQSGMVDDFIDRKQGRAQVSYPHRKLEAILEPTYGVILYQEQVMEIAQVLAGYSLGEADLLRRAMGKKKPEEMAQQREIFVNGALAREVKESKANQIFDLMEKFAGYGFNKSHSAAYALIAYQTAWLKAHYPAAYMAAVLSADMDHTDKVVVMIEEARALGLTVQGPDINQSNWAFEAQGEDAIAYGLGAIKGVGKGAVAAVIASREDEGEFDSLQDFCRRVASARVNRRVMEVLILAGALDSLGANRATLTAALPGAIQAAEQISRDASVGQSDIFGGALSESGQTTGSDVAELPPWPVEQRLKGERETLGLYFSGHPVDQVQDELRAMAYCSIADIPVYFSSLSAAGPRQFAKRKSGPVIVLGGLVMTLRKRDGRMAFATLDDKTGRIEATFFEDAYRQYGAQLQADEIILVEGQLGLDNFTGGYRLDVQRMWDLDAARKHFAKGIEVELNGAGAAGVKKLCKVLAAYRDGPAPVWVEFRGSAADARLKLGEEWQVSVCTSLLDSLRRSGCVCRTRVLY